MPVMGNEVLMGLFVSAREGPIKKNLQLFDWPAVGIESSMTYRNQII